MKSKSFRVHSLQRSLSSKHGPNPLEHRWFLPRVPVCLSRAALRPGRTIKVEGGINSQVAPGPLKPSRGNSKSSGETACSISIFALGTPQSLRDCTSPIEQRHVAFRCSPEGQYPKDGSTCWSLMTSDQKICANTGSWRACWILGPARAKPQCLGSCPRICAAARSGRLLSLSPTAFVSLAYAHRFALRGEPFSSQSVLVWDPFASICLLRVEVTTAVTLHYGKSKLPLPSKACT